MKASLFVMEHLSLKSNWLLINNFGHLASRYQIINTFCLPHKAIFTYAYLTHWDRVTYICVSKLTIIGSDNGLSPGQHQVIIWTNAGILLMDPWEQSSVIS